MSKVLLPLAACLAFGALAAPAALARPALLTTINVTAGKPKSFTSSSPRARRSAGSSSSRSPTRARFHMTSSCARRAVLAREHLHGQVDEADQSRSSTTLRTTVAPEGHLRVPLYRPRPRCGRDEGSPQGHLGSIGLGPGRSERLPGPIQTHQDRRRVACRLPSAAILQDLWKSVGRARTEPMALREKGTPSRWRFHPPSPQAVRPGPCGLPRSVSGGGIDLLALRAR